MAMGYLLKPQTNRGFSYGVTCLAVASIVGACGASIKTLRKGFPDRLASPTLDQVAADMDATSYIFSLDDTFVSDPTQWLGMVGVEESDDCKDPNKKTSFKWLPTSILGKQSSSKPLGFPLTSPTKPAVRKSRTMTVKFAAKIDAFKTVAASASGQSVLEMIITDQRIQRIKNSSEFSDAYASFLTERKATIDKACRVIVVKGLAHKTITFREMSKVKGDLRVQASAVNFEGELYYDSSGYELEHVFGLSVVEVKNRVKKNPPAAFNVESSEALSATDLSRYTKQILQTPLPKR